MYRAVVLAVLAICFLAVGASAAITLDAASSGNAGVGATSLTLTHTLGSGSNRVVVCGVQIADPTTAITPSTIAPTVTFGGLTMTAIPTSLSPTTSSKIQSEMFYLNDTSLGAMTGAETVFITLPLTPSGGVAATCSSFFGVAQAAPESVGTLYTGASMTSTTATGLTATLAPNVGDLVVDSFAGGFTLNSGGKSEAPNSPQTLLTASANEDNQAGGILGGSSYELAPTSSVTTGWTATCSRGAYSAVAFAQAMITSYTVTPAVSPVGGGTIALSPTATNNSYASGASVQVTATPAANYTFAGFSGLLTGSTSPATLTVTATGTVTANFVQSICTLTTTSIGQGTITPASNSYPCGTIVNLTATPSSGYTFANWSGTGYSGTNSSASFTLTTSTTETATFLAANTCTLGTSVTGSGTITLNPAGGTYTCGASVIVSATPATDWSLTGFSGALTGATNPQTLTLNASTTVAAVFTQTSFPVNVSVEGSGTVAISANASANSDGTYPTGTKITLTATPNSGSIFTGFSGSLVSETSPATLSVTGAENVTATFIRNPAGITGDTRTVTEPVYPPVCAVLTAEQSLANLIETAPDTTRVQAALNACSVGQAVEFSASSDGTENAFIIAPITLPAGVTMLVDPAVTILGSIKYADYACNTSESWCDPLISVAPNAYPNPGSGIMGLGVIDGRGGVTLTDKGESWWATGSDARPRLIYLSSHTTGASSDNFTAYKITLQNSPKFHLSGVGNDLTVWGIKVKAPPDSPNTDGVDPSGSSNITITKSYISDGDDWISPKADSGHIANVTIDNDYTYSGHGISIGSETNAGLNNMYVHDIVIDNGFGGTSFDSLRIKSASSEGGEVYDVLYKNICINNGGDTIVINPYYSSGTGTLYPNFHDITFSNIHKLLHNSSYKSTMEGYNTNGIVFPLTVTLDNVAFDNDAANDFKAPSNFNNVQFTFGPGPVSMASFLTTDAGTASNLITVNNDISNSNTPLNCTGVFVYLAGDLTAPSNTVTAGNPFTLNAVLQNLVSPLMAGTVSYPQQNMPTGTIEILEGVNVVGTGQIASGSRVTNITIPTITAGTHTYTAQYTGDTNYASGLSFGSFTVVANAAPPVAVSQSLTTAYNTATSITLSATGSGTLTYSIVASPLHGSLSGTAPNLTYTPAVGYAGSDSFTFKANNGTDSNIATVALTISPAAQSITFPAIATSVTYGVSPIVLGATASSGLPINYSVTGLATLNGNTLTITGAGSVKVTASQAGNSIYAAATPVAQSIVVNPATLTVTANNASRAVGAANPAFSASYAGFVNGDTSSVLGGLPSLSTTATASSATGIYPITVTQGALTASNYTFTFVNGSLTVANGVVLTTTASLSKVTGGYQAVITVTNSGASAASNVQLTSAKLGAATNTAVPVALGTLAAGGGSAKVTLTFPGTAGSDGAAAAETYAGTYTGGSFSASIRAVLP